MLVGYTYVFPRWFSIASPWPRTNWRSMSSKMNRRRMRNKISRGAEEQRIRETTGALRAEGSRGDEELL